MHSTELVTLTMAATASEAYVLKGVLEGAGIPCMLADEMLSTIHPSVSHAMGGIRILVHVQNFETARAVLSSADTGRLLQCPECGSLALEPVTDADSSAGDIVAYRCLDCGGEIAPLFCE